jgi:hypothetical protein
VPPAGDLGAGDRQVPVTPRPQLHHRGVILAADLLRCRRSQRGDGHRQGVVRVVVVRRLRGQQPHPCGQLRLHVQDPLASGDQLLSEQVAEPGRVLDRPGALPEPLSPQPRQASLGLVHRHRCVRPLVRVHADHHRHRVLLPRASRGPWSACLIAARVSARSRLFRARPRRDPTAGTSFGSQAATATGRRFVSSAVRVSRRYEPAAPPWWTLNQTALVALRPG